MTRPWPLFALLLLTSCSTSNPTEPAPGNACPASTGGPTPHAGFLTADETWTAAASPHVITSSLTVSKDVTLQLEPCAEVRIAGGQYFYVSGQLVARGTPTQRIRILRDDPAKRFTSLWVTSGGRAELAYLDLEGGGAVDNQTYGATLVVEGKDFPPTQPIAVDNVTVSDSAGYGIWLWRWGGFSDDSKDLTVSGAGKELSDRPFPINMSLNAVHTLPPGNYTGNAVDEIQLFGESPHNNVEIAEHIRNRGVPYQVGGNGEFGVITVLGGAEASLTVDPGVTLKFFSSGSNVGGLNVGGTGDQVLGQLVAVGTAEAPIVFTGAGQSPAAGAWEGITFVGPLAAGNRLEHVRIEAAGAHGGDVGFGCAPSGGTDGALKLFTQPAAAFLKSSAVVHSSSHGVFEAYDGAEVDFMTGNTFEDVAGCNQVIPKTTDGKCPDPPPCPK
jgi:hypothetical protein